MTSSKLGAAQLEVLMNGLALRAKTRSGHPGSKKYHTDTKKKKKIAKLSRRANRN